MRTVRCSGRRGVSAQAACLPEGISSSGGGRSARGCLPRGVFAQELSAPVHAGIHTLPGEQNDKHLWKHNLSATTVADGNENLAGYSVFWPVLGHNFALHLLVEEEKRLESWDAIENNCSLGVTKFNEKIHFRSSLTTFQLKSDRICKKTFLSSW